MIPEGLRSSSEVADLLDALRVVEVTSKAHAGGPGGGTVVEERVHFS